MNKPTYEEMISVRIASASTAKEYLMKSIWYLCSEDIDKSGRGYYWPRFMRVNQVCRREFHDVESGRYVPFRNIQRILVVENKEPVK